VCVAFCRHGDAVAHGEGHGVLLAAEAGVAVEQNVAGDVGEGEDVTWRNGGGVSAGVMCVYV